jgi:hypothetical protein
MNLIFDFINQNRKTSLCLEKISILPFIISATGIVPQSLLKNLKILDLENTLVVEIQKGILLYSCHIVRKFLFCSTLSEFENFLLCERILINVTTCQNETSS